MNHDKVFFRMLAPPRLTKLVGAMAFSFMAILSTGIAVAQPPVATQDDSQKFDWPGFLGPKRNGLSKETGILTNWKDGNLKILWRVPVGRGYVLGAVAGNEFYQFDAVDNNCRLICRNAESGDELWRFAYPFEYQDSFGFEIGPRATPLIDGKHVYIYGVEGKLHCLDRNSRSVVWELDVNRKFGVVKNFFGVGSSPIVHDQFLIVMVGGSQPFETRSGGDLRLDSLTPNGTAIVVFDKMTGEPLHQFGEDHASYSSMQLYQSKGQTRGVAWLRDSLIGFDIEKGVQLWKFPYRSKKYESVNASTPVVEGERIFVSESYGPGGLLLDVTDGKPQVVWNDSNPRQQSLATHWNTPVLVDGKLYGCHGSGGADVELRCVDWATGKVDWRQKGLGRSSLTYADGHLLVLDERGQLLLIKATADSYQLVTQYSDADAEKLPLDYPCWAAPVIANHRLYLRGKEEILCLDLMKR